MEGTAINVAVIDSDWTVHCRRMCLFGSAKLLSPACIVAFPLELSRVMKVF